MDITVRSAKKEDYHKVISFLQRANLSIEGIIDSIEHFLIMEDREKNIEATIGIEPYGSDGLLRSLVMTASVAEKYVYLMFEQVLLFARDRGLTDIYLATNKDGAVRLVKMLGFQPVNSEELPESLHQSAHVRSILSVDNSVFLRLNV